MPKNKELLEMLQGDGSTFLQGLDEPKQIARIAALDALLALDHEEVESFKTTVRTHATAWGIFDAAEWIRSHTQEDQPVPTEDDYYQSDDFLNPVADDADFYQIRTEAAALRVKLGVNKIVDQEVLLNILIYNEEECRAYLAEKVAPAITNAHGWVESVIPEPVDGVQGLAKNTSSEVLSRLDIDKIKELALQRWVILAVQKTDNIQALNKLSVLINVLDNGDEPDKKLFNEALKELGFDSNAQNIKIKNANIIREILRGTESAVNERKGKINDSLAADLSAAYKKHFDDMSEDGVRQQAELLVKDEKEFRDGLPELPGKEGLKVHLKTPQLDELREQLGARYLVLVLPTKTAEEHLRLARTPSLEAFREELRNLFPGHPYIDKVVNQEKMDEYKKIIGASAVTEAMPLLTDIVKKLEITEAGIATVKKLGATQTTVKFKEALSNAVTDPGLKGLISQLSDLQIMDLQQAARTRRLEMQLDRDSHFKSFAAHPELITAFALLGIKEQNDLLNANGVENNPSSPLPHILNAKDPSVLKHYLKSLSKESIASVLAEKEKNDSLRSIHNAKVVQVLGSIAPLISKLDDNAVRNINDAFKGVVVFGDDQYIAMVNRIKTQCAVSETNNEAFYKAFGLANDGLTVSSPKKIMGEVNLQQQENAELLEEYYDPEAVTDKELLDFLLRVEKVAGVPHCSADNIQVVFAGAKNSEQFISRYMNLQGKTILTAGEKKAVGILQRELTSTLFNSLKKDMQNRIFAGNDPESIKSLLPGMESTLKTLEKSHDVFESHKKGMVPILRIQDIHINNPVFQSKSKEMRQKYMELAEQCDVLIDQLRTDRSLLEANIENTKKLPADDSVHNGVRKQVDKLQIDLVTELNRTEAQIKFYNQVKTKISEPEGILAKINTVNSRHLTYNRDGITTYLIERNVLETTAIKQGSPSGSTPVTVISVGGEDNEVAKFALDDKPNSGQIRCFDVVYKDDDRPNILIEGRFTYDTENKKTAIEGYEDKVSKSDPGKLEIRQFPTHKGTDHDPEVLIKAKVEFAIAVATQLLANMDGPPSKENPIRLAGTKPEELQYIWTALVILGEKTPKMKFDSDAIRVNARTTVFDPAEQKGFFGYASNSLYKTVFTNPVFNPLVKEAVAAAKEQANERLSTTKAKTAEKMIDTTIGFYKEQLKTTKEETEKRRQKEGVNPEPSSPRPGGSE